jgi:hypothetical protein
MRSKTSVIRISGGLGNQLFQYAFSRNIEIETSGSILLDLGRFNFDSGRNARKCELKDLFPGALFSNDLSLPLSEFLSRFLPNQVSHVYLSKNEREIRAKEFFKGRRVALEKHFPYDGSISLGGGNYYIGNFISPEYWWSNQQRIIEEIDQAISNSALFAESLLPNENTIAIHIRRGDYLENRKTREFHGYCKDSYYLQAINNLCEIDGSLDSVLISSDNVAYAYLFSKKIRAMGLRVSILENLDAISSLHILSRSQYFVGSNSTFSWWAAFLSNKKSIVFPRYWFIDESFKVDSFRFYPSPPMLLTNALTSEPDSSN